MKTNFLLVLFLVFFITKSEAQKFGVQAGATFYSFKDKIETLTLNADPKVGVTVGVIASLPISRSIAFMPSLNFTQKGGSLSGFTDSADQIKIHYTFNYLELPLNFVYNIPVKGGEIFVGAGPNIGWALGGKEKANGESSDLSFGSGTDNQFKALEFGANVLAGFKWNTGLFVTANYNPGLTDISNIESADVDFHNHGFGIRIGIMLHARAEKKSSESQ